MSEDLNLKEVEHCVPAAEDHRTFPSRTSNAASFQRVRDRVCCGKQRPVFDGGRWRGSKSGKGELCHAKS